MAQLLTLKEVGRIEELTGFTAGECQKCHQPVDKKAFYCRKHTKRGWLKAVQYKNSDAYKAEMLAREQRGEERADKKRRARELNKLYAEKGFDFTSHSLPQDTPTFYDNYKEPLTEVKTAKGEGYGYMGVIARNESGDYIQCHICGGLYESLHSHVSGTHKMTAREYKTEFGLRQTNALIGERLRDVRIKARELGEEHGLLKDMTAVRERIIAYNLTNNPSRYRHRKDEYTLEEQNLKGTCPEQTLEKLTDLIKELGRVPTSDEFKAHYHNRWVYPYKRHFGNWQNFVNAAGYKSVKEAHENAVTAEQLIGYLKDFYAKHQRVPMNSDFKRGIMVPKYQYWKTFGTLNNARIEAGLPAVIAMPGHRYYLVKPEQYTEYQLLKDQSHYSTHRRGKDPAMRPFFDQLEEVDYAELYGEVLV